jgi:hypothetical protein
MQVSIVKILAQPRLFRFLFLVSIAFALPTVQRVPLRSQERSTSSSTKEVLRANQPAPELYSNQLRMTITLVNLPGATNSESNFSGSCALYFVPEADWIQTTRQMPSGGLKLNASDFKGRLKLTEINFKNGNLANLKDRIRSQDKIPFGSRIPAEQKTKLARLITDCAVKVYDGQLKTSLYSSGVLVTRPFEAESEDFSKLHPRANIYVSFLVTPEGKIYRSQAPRKPDSLEWP